MASSFFEITEHTFRGQHVREYHQGLVHPNKPPLLKAKQYTPRSNPNPQSGDVTIIAAIGIGLVKELAEPLFEDLTKKCHEQGTKIRSIWIVDMYNLAGNASLNQNEIGNDPSWFDHSRDLLCMINKFAHLMPVPLFGLGHSMGGAQIVYLSHLHPRLFQTLILVEPALWDTALWGIEAAASVNHSRAMAFRRETFSSLPVLHSSLSRSHYYRTWDKRALANLVKYGFSLQPDGTMKSTTSVHSDLAMMGRPNLAGTGRTARSFADISLEERKKVPDIMLRNGWYAPWYRPEPNRLFHMLPNLRPSVLYVVGEKGQNPELRVNGEILRNTGTGWGGSGGVEMGRVKRVVVKDGGHVMIVDKSLGEVVDAAAEWIKAEMEIWRRQEAEHKASDWAKRPDSEKFKVDDQLWRTYRGKTSPEDILKGKL
ncbi:hypothetical protein VTL71DRAFT_6151 [Oculimacula yallundae]|uniref:Serine aminopeptidase S33 domain-containing protein n=1 Tax=Oculimacula yallundae TaxID=86028 RepID=A0ABR4C173_9HELO